MVPTRKGLLEVMHRIGRWAWAVAFLGLVSPLRAEAVSVRGDSFSSEQRRWWAFQPVVKPPIPGTDRDDWSRSPIDRFVLTSLRAASLQPAPRADRRVLVRRLYYDLTGLPPSPEDVRRFLQDRSPDAFGSLVERLLASPRYGEKWGQHWMDVARYADTAGDNADYPVPEARFYRDYIIGAFNRDKPYRDFVIEQLAGDVIAADGPREAYAERVAATGFLALSRRYATAPFELMHLTVEDAIETTGRAFMGMTLRCARCHDHKYDPVSSREYYGLYGLFASTRFPYAGSEEFQSKNLARTGFVPLTPVDETVGLARDNQARVEVLKKALKGMEAALESAKTNASAAKPDAATLAATRTELKRRERFDSPPGVTVAYAVSEATPVDETMHTRGDPAERGVAIPRCAPSIIGGGGNLGIAPGSSGRREFAEWLVRPQHPLTARVIVNRLWQHHFGRGLVNTPSNFGLRGDRPSHPELLDYLAATFTESGGSLRTMHRLILNSATWQESWIETPELAGRVDPANTLLWRHDRRRLDAESLRDTFLMMGGDLDLSWPGPHPFPKFEDFNWTQHTPFKAVYESNHRSVYLMRQRIQRHPFLALFDAPDANVSTDLRTSATVPPQALYLMNHPFVARQAAVLADGLRARSTEPSVGLREVCERAWGRVPKPEETNRMIRFLGEFVAEARRAGSTETDAWREGWTSVCRSILISNECLYLD